MKLATANFLLAATLLLPPTCALAQTKPAATQPAAPHWVQGQRVELLKGNQWWAGTVKDVRGDSVLVHREPFANLDEWVPAVTVRKYSKAGKYPYPATDAEIDANAAPIRRARLPKFSDTDSSPAARPDEFVDAGLSPADTSAVNRLADNPDLPLPAGLAADPEPAPKSVATRPMPLSGNPKADASPFAPRPAGLFAAPAAGQVFTLRETPGIRAVKLIQRFDAATGSPSPVVAIESSLTVNAVSPDGKRLVGINKARQGHFSEPYAVEVWSIEKEPKLLVAFAPQMRDVDKYSLQLARFTDNDHVLTFDDRGHLTLWEIPAAKAVYTRDLGHGVSSTALSPAGKYIAVATGQAVGLLDAATGAVLGQLPAADPPIHPSHLAFSPAGDRLLAAEQQRTVVYDLTKPAVVADISLPMPLYRGEFLSDAHLLVDGRYLVDVAKGAVLWDYTHGNSPSTIFAGRLWYLSQPQSPHTHSLYSASLPTPDALKAAAPGPDELYAVQAGTKVSLDLSTGLNSENQAKARAAIRDAVTAAGWVLADDAPIHVVATNAAGESQEITYRMFGGGTTKVSAATHTYTLSVQQQDGKTLWQTSIPVRPSFMIHLKKDQTLEQYLDEERERFATGFFTGVHFPRNLAKPTDHPGAGQTTLPGTDPAAASPKGPQPKQTPSRRPPAPSRDKATSA